MGESYKPITSMKEVPEQLRKLRRQYMRYQQAEIIYSISHQVNEKQENSIRLKEWWVAESLKQIQIFLDILSATCRLPVHEFFKYQE